MTRVQAYSHRRLLFAASTFFLIAVVVVIPRRLVAQEQKLNSTNELLNVAQRRLLNSIKIKYTLTQHLDGPLSSSELKGAQDFVIQRDWLLDLKDFRFALTRKIWSADNPKTSDPNDRLFKIVWDGKLFTEWQVGENFADTDPHLPKKDKNDAAADPLLRAILIYRPTSAGFGFGADDGSLISLLRAGHVRQGSEEIDGRPCCVVESTDGAREWVVWLDNERSLAPLKVQKTLHGKEKEFVEEWHLTDFVKLSGDGQDFWCPMKVDLTSRGNSVIHKQIIVDQDETKINPTISDASFRVDFPRGTVVHDEGTNTTSVIGRNKNTKVLPQGAAKEAEGTLRREEADNKTNGVLKTVERKIVKEPNYTSTPRYALLVLGTKAEAKIWMVEDGNVLYVDKNGNGDLTDDGPPIPQSKIRTFQSGASRDCEYVLDELQPLGGSHQTNFCLRRWNYGDNEDEYGLSLTLDGKVPMYAGWFDTFWADSPEKVPLIHFGGPLKPKLLRAERFVLGSTLPRLSIAFLNSGSGKGATSYLSIEALPETTVPEVRIDWPVKEGDAPVRTYELLKSRCCYWEFFEQNLKIPSGITEGSATLTISVSHDVFPFDLTTDQIQIPVRAQ